MPRRLAIALVSAVACGGGGGDGGVEGQIRRDLSRQLGVRVERVRCPDGSYPKTCTAEMPGGAAVPVALAEGADGVDWSLAGFVISTAPLEVEIAAELDDLGVEATVDCGASYVTTDVGERIACRLAFEGGGEGAAWARIRDDAGRFDVELALDPAAVTARTAEVDEAELERRSRALAEVPEVGEVADGPAAAADAGVDGGAP